MAMLLRVERTGHSGNNLTFQAEFDSVPSTQDIQQAQIKAGYHPCGYGGPFHIANAGCEGRKVTFACNDSCD